MPLATLLRRIQQSGGGPPPPSGGAILVFSDTGSAKSSNDGASWSSSAIDASYTISGDYRLIKGYGFGYFWIVTTDDEMILVTPDGTGSFLYAAPFPAGEAIVMTGGQFLAATANGSGNVAFYGPPQNFTTLPSGATAWTVGAQFSGLDVVFLAQGVSVYSTAGDGTGWTSAGNPGAGITWAAVNYTPGSNFTAVAPNHIIGDGLGSWTPLTGTPTHAFKDVAGFVAIADSHNGAINNGDGTVTPVTLPGASTPTAIAYDIDSGVHMFVLSGVDQDAYTSTNNGGSWTTQSNVLPAAVEWGSAAGQDANVGNVNFGIVSTDGSNIFASSTDVTAAAWNEVTPVVALLFEAAAWNGAVVCAVAFPTREITISSDSGTTWTPGEVPKPFVSGNFIAHVGSALWAIDFWDHYYALSTDNGASWTVAAMPVTVHLHTHPGTQSTAGIIVTSPTTLCIVTADTPATNIPPPNPVATTTDGTSYNTTTIDWSGGGAYSPSATYGNGKFFVDSGAALYGTTDYGWAVSTDEGETWTTNTISAADHPFSINIPAGGFAYGNGLIVAASLISPHTQGAAVSADEGATWTVYDSVLPEANMIGPTFNGTVFVMVGNGTSTIATSADGATWATSTLPGGVAVLLRSALVSEWIQS